MRDILTLVVKRHMMVCWESLLQRKKKRRIFPCERVSPVPCCFGGFASMLPMLPTLATLFWRLGLLDHPWPLVPSPALPLGLMPLLRFNQIRCFECLDGTNEIYRFGSSITKRRDEETDLEIQITLHS